MKHLITVFAFAIAACTGVVHAADDAASAPKAKPHRVRTLTPEQMKMDDCTGQAESKPREERQAFIKDCVAGTPDAAPSPRTKPARVKKLTPEQQAMVSCDGRAAGLTSTQREDFLKKCYAGEPTDVKGGPHEKAARVKKLTPEQQKRADCAAGSVSKSRDERYTYVEECIKQ